MAQPDSTPTSDDTRERILEAASARFMQYGYGKTTMAEIAQDAGMSAANLYRYFDNKRDIGAGLALRCFEEKEALLERVAGQPGRSAAERLEALVLAMLHYTHGQCHGRPLINELVEDVACHRPDIVRRKIDGEHAIVTRILADGRRSGEFDFEDLNATGHTVLNAIVMFGMPLFMQTRELDRFEVAARDVVRLLVRGLASR